ncbi:Trm112 family protein [Nocardioides sp. zg-DK7169]|uniref:Trm112 family protein n=1 Tax=Nocardioides sp. zg-DK7169 TaxID=2736600 RepID=UPI001555212B|nr:Trm112 family protein [Nocardioides sp. zg-DK7169]NPC95921.1 Trm112 family protein [Nocardioides sp. zg-DK7169]
MSTSLDPALLAIVVCPGCHGDLEQVTTDGETELACRGECGLVYPVRDGIPVLLVDEARKPA